MQKNNFLLYLRNPCEKHIFRNFKYLFFYKKKHSKHVRVLAVCMKTFFWYICIFVTLRRKPGILNTRVVFLQYKNTKKNHKINTKKNNDITRFFRGWVQVGPCGWAEPSRPSRVTGPNQWPDWAQRHAWVSSRMPWLIIVQVN
jgi:hypothetical protein